VEGEVWGQHEITRVMEISSLRGGGFNNLGAKALNSVWTA
jgi:hypothetical protein